MAKLQEIIAKREELAKTNPNATNVDARKALTATPATPPATPTPIPATTNVMDQMAGKTVAERQAIRNGTPATPAPAPITPAPITQAPVDPTTGLSKPLETTPAPATPATTVPAPVTPTKVEPVVDFNKSQGRESEIQKNVTDITTANPTLLKDRNAFNQAFGYDTADQGKKAMLDATFNGQVKPSQDDIFNSLRQGITVGDPKSVEYRQAQARLATFKKYSVYDTASIATSLSSGDLLVGTRAYNDLVSDPTMALKIQKAQAFNKGVVDLVKTGETQMANVLASNPTIATALSDGYMSKAEYDQLTNNAEVSAQGKLVETNKTKYETIKAQYDAVEDDVDKEYTGKEVTDSFKAKIVADRRKGMYKDYQIASLEYQNALGTYTNLKSDATALLAQNMDLYKTQQAQQAEIAKEERAMKNSLALSQAQFEQKVAQQAQQMSTPELAIPSVLEQYASQGIFAQKSAQQHIADAKALIARGGTLGEYISQMQKDFQEKDAYKAKFTGNLNDTQKLLMQQEMENKRDARNFAQQKELAILNKDLGRQEFLWQIENDPEKKAKALEIEQKLNANKSLFDVLGKNVGTYEGNRGYDLAGAIGDPLPAGGNWTVKSIDTAGEQVGSIFIGGKGSKPYGNTVVMQDENGNEIRYSHLQDIGVKQGDVLGFGDIVGTRGNTGNVKGANGEILTAEQLKAGRGAHLDIEIKSNGKLLSNADQVNFLKGLKAGGTQPLSDQKFTQFNQTTSKFYSNPQVKSFEDALNAGGDMITSLKSANGPGDVGAVFSFMKSLDPASVVKEGEFKLARESGGLDAKFDNLYGKIVNGEQLTEEQRKAFGKISFEYIKSKGRMYDSKYNDMVKVLENQGIPKSYYPTRMTDYINQYENGGDTNTKTNTQNTPFTMESLEAEWNNF